MAIGATLGAVNSLYVMVDSLHREIATLRALGFSPGAVVLAVLLESMLLALPGALLGSAVAWLLFNGLAASPFGCSFRPLCQFSLDVLGIEWALAMGLLGGLLPALRAARMPVVTRSGPFDAKEVRFPVGPLSTPLETPEPPKLSTSAIETATHLDS